MRLSLRNSSIYICRNHPKHLNLIEKGGASPFWFQYSGVEL